jgi:subtilisin family serine protease
MARFGPLLESVRHLLVEYPEPASFLQAFHVPPLPVRIAVDNKGELRVDLLVTLDQGDANQNRELLGQLVNRGLEVHAVTGRIATGTARGIDLSKLVEAPANIFIEAAAAVHPELDRSVPEAWNAKSGRIPSGLTGAGVIIGIVDTGIDFTHPCFRTLAGESRVLWLWDQSLWAGQMPASFPYGTEWDRAAIAAHLSAVKSLNPPNVAHLDSTGHGTAIAGIAAGNGLATPVGRYVGVAPEADLVVVAIDAPQHAFPSSKNVIDGIKYIFDKADSLGRRAVVNLSQGSWLGPHQSGGQFECAVDDCVRADDRRVVVTSAGNAGAYPVHSRVLVTNDFSPALWIEVPKLAGPWIAVDIWYDLGDRLEARLSAPYGGETEWIRADRLKSGYLSSGAYELSGVLNSLPVGANHLHLQIKASQGQSDVTPGSWLLQLRPLHIANPAGAAVDAWIERSAFVQAGFQTNVTRECTITAPATASQVIVAGSYGFGGKSSYKLSKFSGQGPSRLGHPLQMLTAPGDPVTSSAPNNLNNSAYAKPSSGTSYSAAIVTGAVALLLQAVPNLSRPRAIGCLLSSARMDRATAADPSAWGAGKLDIAAALKCAKAESLKPKPSRNTSGTSVK